MRTSKPRVAVDTCVLLNVLKGGEGEPEHRLPAGRDLLGKVRDGLLEALVPAIVPTEIVANKGTRRAGSDVQKRMLADSIGMFAEHGFIIAGMGVRASERSALLAVDHHLLPGDAAVLACALAARADALYTWDSDLLNLGSVDDVKIIEPPAPELDLFNTAASLDT